MYAVYKNVDSDGAKVLDVYFTDFEQAHYYVMLQPGRQGQPQSPTSFEIAYRTMSRSDAVSYSGFHVRRVKAMDVNFPLTNYKELFQHTSTQKTELMMERAIYDLEEMVAELTSSGMSRGDIGELFQNAIDSRQNGE